jgi:hypothetical protein
MVRRGRAGAGGPRLNDAARAQIAAAEPGASAWVSANAGSGKTRVLTDRVARLLLSGTDPQRILCLTYTKAAAAEMQNRLFARLGEWSMLPDGRPRRRTGRARRDRRRARRPEPRPRPHPLRPRAGDPRRPEDPDHPRLLRHAPAPLPAGGRRRAAVRRARRPERTRPARGGAGGARPRRSRHLRRHGPRSLRRRPRPARRRDRRPPRPLRWPLRPRPPRRNPRRRPRLDT